MSNQAIMLYGASGCGRGVMPLLRENCNNASDDIDLYFVDDNHSEGYINGQKVCSYEHFKTLAYTRKKFNIAIANSKVREILAKKCIGDGLEPFPIFSKNVVIMDDVQFGNAPILSPFVTITSNIVIGDFFHANLYSYVEHDCIIGDFVTFGPGVKCNGNVHIQDHVYVGSGAMIKNGTPSNPIVIGTGAIIGMGAVVTKSVEPYDTVVGNPSRKLGI